MNALAVGRSVKYQLNVLYAPCLRERKPSEENWKHLNTLT